MERCDRHSNARHHAHKTSNVVQHPFQTVEGSRLRDGYEYQFASFGVGDWEVSPILLRHMFPSRTFIATLFHFEIANLNAIWSHVAVSVHCTSTMYIIIRIAFITYLFIIYSFSIHQRGRTELWSIRIQKWHYKRPCHLLLAPLVEGILDDSRTAQRLQKPWFFGCNPCRTAY